jgi:hypothetical protein
MEPVDSQAQHYKGQDRGGADAYAAALRWA